MVAISAAETFCSPGGISPDFEPIEQVTLVGMSGSDGVARLAPLNHEASQPEVESPFADVLTAVTIEAVRPDDRPDVLLERRPMRRQGSRRRRGTRKKRRDYKERRGRSAIDADAISGPPLPRLATIHPSLCISGLSGPPPGHARPALDRAFVQTLAVVGRIVWGESVSEIRTCGTFAERSARRYAGSPQKWFSQNGQI